VHSITEALHDLELTVQQQQATIEEQGFRLARVGGLQAVPVLAGGRALAVNVAAVVPLMCCTRTQRRERVRPGAAQAARRPAGARRCVQGRRRCGGLSLAQGSAKRLPNQFGLSLGAYQTVLVRAAPASQCAVQRACHGFCARKCVRASRVRAQLEGYACPVPTILTELRRMLDAPALQKARSPPTAPAARWPPHAMARAGRPVCLRGSAERRGRGEAAADARGESAAASAPAAAC
jgi:hypothetical protein